MKKFLSLALVVVVTLVIGIGIVQVNSALAIPPCSEACAHPSGWCLAALVSCHCGQSFTYNCVDYYANSCECP